MKTRFNVTVYAMALLVLPFLTDGLHAGQTGRAGDNVHLFQSFLRDATIASLPYAEAGFEYDDFDAANRKSIGVQGGFPVLPDLELNARLGVINIDPDRGDDETGLSDITLGGRYNINRFLEVTTPGTQFAAGGYLTLPVGDEDVGEDNVNVGIFGAMRHDITSNVIFATTVGLDFIETTDRRGEDDRETSLFLGGGFIFTVDDRLNFVTELDLMTETDYMMLSGGADYMLDLGRLRAALGVGLDDGAPDMALMISYLVNF